MTPPVDTFTVTVAKFLICAIPILWAVAAMAWIAEKIERKKEGQ